MTLLLQQPILTTIMPTCSHQPLLAPSVPLQSKFRVTYGNKHLSATENGVPRFTDEVIELPCGSTIGDLFNQLYQRNPTDPGHEWSIASPLDRLIYRYPCKNDVLLSTAFPYPEHYNLKGEIEILADQDHLLTEAATIMKDYDFMITLIKRLPIPQAVDQRKRVICCLSKVVTGIINRIRYRPELPQFCYPNCVHQVEFNKLRIYANSVADGSIFGLNVTPTLTITNTSHNEDAEECGPRRKRTRREAFPIESLPEEIISHILTFAGPKELCNFEQVSTAFGWRVNQSASLWAKFCNGWKLRTEDEEALGFKDVVKTVYEIQACRQAKKGSI